MLLGFIVFWFMKGYNMVKFGIGENRSKCLKKTLDNDLYIINLIRFFGVLKYCINLIFRGFSKVVMRRKVSGAIYRFFSLEVFSIFFILMLFISGFFMYYLNRPVNPSVQLVDLVFGLDPDHRWLELSVRVKAGIVELKQFFVNNLTVYNWRADKIVVREGEEVRCFLEFPWRMGVDHIIRLVTGDERSFELVGRAPIIEPELDLGLGEVTKFIYGNLLRLRVDYWVEGKGIDHLHVLLFAYRKFERLSRPIYLFYDVRYMAEEAMKRAEYIVDYLRSRSLAVNLLDYSGLEGLSRDMPRAVLILVNPLEDGHGRRLWDAAPAPLIDPNRNGYLRDDSRYGRSFLYDWMADGGLILITVGTHQPYKRILYRDGSYGLARDSLDALDAHLFLTSAQGDENVIKGAGFLGNYSPVRLSGTLGLSYREEAYAFDRVALESYGLSYYAYGEYKLAIRGGNLTLVIPTFIRVGRGGWLAMGDLGFWLDEERMSHDLFMMILHSIWDADWVPYGWYWDNGAGFHSGGGVIRAIGHLETEKIPMDIVGEELYIRIIGVAYSEDLGRGVIQERFLKYRVR